MCIFAQVPYSCIHQFYNTINVIKFLMLKFVKSQTVKKCASILSRSSLWCENSTFYNSKLNISISMSEYPTHLILKFTKHLIWNSEELLRNRMKKFNILQILQYTHSINGHLIKEHENSWNCPCWDWNKIGQFYLQWKHCPNISRYYDRPPGYKIHGNHIVQENTGCSSKYPM